MKIVYKDPTEQFKQLLQTAISQRHAVSQISVTQQEMEMLVKHRDAKLYFGDYINERNAKVVNLKNKLSVLQGQSATAKDMAAKMKLFDEQSVIERQISDLENAVPKQIVQSNVIVKVTMNG